MRTTNIDHIELQVMQGYRKHTIVSPDHLYIRSSDLKFVERIERTFRMALGIVNVEGAIVNERLEKLQSDRESLLRRSELLGKKRLEFEEDVTSLQNEAVSLGILDEPSEDAQESLELLREIANSPIERFNNIDEQLKDLEFREHVLNRKLSQSKKFNEGFRAYQSLLKESDDSLRPVTYLVDRYREILPSTKSSEILQALEEELSTVKQSWKQRNKSSLYVDVNEQSQRLDRELKEIRVKIKELKECSDRLSSPQEIYRYQGKLEVKVDLYSDKASPIDYTEKIAGIDIKINQLNSVVQDLESKREFVMGNLNEKINDHLSRMKLKGYEASKAVFLEKGKAINLILDEGRTVEKMADIGSASNYLYIHLSVSVHFETSFYTQLF